MTECRLFLLEGLSPDAEQSYWRQVTERHRYQRGDTIYDSALARAALAVVLSGEVCVYHGRVVMNILRAGDVFGAAALYGLQEAYASRVVADSECEVAFIPQETVSRWMASEPRVAENYVRFLSDRIRFLNRRLATLTAGQTDGKLWRYLLAYADDEGVVRISGGMTELAKRLNMGRSSLYRSLDSLADDGRIARDGREIRIIHKEETV